MISISSRDLRPATAESSDDGTIRRQDSLHQGLIHWERRVGNSEQQNDPIRHWERTQVRSTTERHILIHELLKGISVTIHLIVQVFCGDLRIASEATYALLYVQYHRSLCDAFREFSCQILTCDYEEKKSDIRSYFLSSRSSQWCSSCCPVRVERRSVYIVYSYLSTISTLLCGRSSSLLL